MKIGFRGVGACGASVRLHCHLVRFEVLTASVQRRLCLAFCLKYLTKGQQRCYNRWLLGLVMETDRNMTAHRSGNEKWLSNGDISLHLSQLHRASAARTALLQVNASPLNPSAFAADCVV